MWSIYSYLVQHQIYRFHLEDLLRYSWITEICSRLEFLKKYCFSAYPVIVWKSNQNIGWILWNVAILNTYSYFIQKLDFLLKWHWRRIIVITGLPTHIYLFSMIIASCTSSIIPTFINRWETWKPGARWPSRRWWSAALSAYRNHKQSFYHTSSTDMDRTTRWVKRDIGDLADKWWWLWIWLRLMLI